MADVSKDLIVWICLQLFFWIDTAQFAVWIDSPIRRVSKQRLFIYLYSTQSQKSINNRKRWGWRQQTRTRQSKIIMLNAWLHVRVINFRIIIIIIIIIAFDLLNKTLNPGAKQNATLARKRRLLRPGRVRSIAMSVTGIQVCRMSASLSSRMYQKPHVQTTRPNFTQSSLRVIRGRGSVLLWRQCSMLCTSGFVYDVIFP